MLTTRVATLHDYDEVIDLFDRSIQNMIGTPLDIEWRWDHHPTRERMHKAVEDGTVLVAEDEQGICGALVLNHDSHGEYLTAHWPSGAAPEDSPVVHLLTVDPDRPREGIGQKLMEYALDVARAQGAKAVRLDVFPYNKPAIALYEKLGFAYIGEAVPYGGPDHADLDLYELAL